MDLNLVVLCGRLAAPPELRKSESGASLVRLLLAVRSELPTRRLDLIPVVTCRPDDTSTDLAPGERVWVSGMLQRRIPGEASASGRSSEIRVVAHQVSRRPADDAIPAD